MKVWHDDVRKPPDESWEWVRTNDEAKTLLLTGAVETISLDHDLGLEEIDPDADVHLNGADEAIPAGMLKGHSPNGTGLDLVEWMCEQHLVPAEVMIHSWNPPGAKAMAARLNHFGHDCVVAPFVAKGA